MQCKVTERLNQRIAVKVVCILWYNFISLVFNVFFYIIIFNNTSIICVICKNIPMKYLFLSRDFGDFCMIVTNAL